MSIIKRARTINWLGEYIWMVGWVALLGAVALAVMVYFHWQPTWGNVMGLVGFGLFSLGLAVALGVWVIYRNGSPPFDRKKSGESEHATVHYTGSADVVADSVMRQAFREESKRFKP